MTSLCIYGQDIHITNGLEVIVLNVLCISLIPQLFPHLLYDSRNSTLLGATGWL